MSPTVPPRERTIICLDRRATVESVIDLEDAVGDDALALTDPLPAGEGVHRLTEHDVPASIYELRQSHRAGNRRASW